MVFYRRWLKIGSGVAIGVTTILGLFILLQLNFGFEIIDLTGNITCIGNYDSPCISEFLVKNPTKYNVDIYSKDQVKLDFSPSILDYALFVKDGRCSATGVCRCELKDGNLIGYKGWRCIDFTNKTKSQDKLVYNHRFSAYSTTNFMLVGFKNNPKDIIKWGFGVNESFLDPYWFGTPDINHSISANVTSLYLELGSQVNISANITGWIGTVCVDIDHPSYGNNYTCGDPNANFLFNISYFHKEVNNTLVPGDIMNYTGGSGSAFILATPFEHCGNITFSYKGVPKITSYVYYTGANPWDYGAGIRIRDSAQNLLEELNDTNKDNIVYSNKVYEANVTYGLCLKNYEGTGSDEFDVNAWVEDYTLEGSDLPNRIPRFKVETASDIINIPSHQYDESINLTLNLTAIHDNYENVKIFINSSLSNSLPIIFNISEGELDTFSDDSTSKNFSFIKKQTKKAYFYLPKDATVNESYMNVSGYNTTWEISSYDTELEAYAELGTPALGTPVWSPSGCPGHCYDEHWNTGCRPYLDPLYDSPYFGYIYENYTVDSDLILGNWSYKAYCDGQAHIDLDIDCYDSSWTSIVSTSNCPLGIKNVSIPSGCLDNADSKLQIKTTLEYDPSGFVYTTLYYEGKVYYYRTGYPENVSIEVGDIDGSYEWEYTNEFEGINNRTNDFSSEITDFLSICTADNDGYCNVPIYITSQDGGKIELSDIYINYTSDLNPLTLDTSLVESFLSNSSGATDIPIVVSWQTAGNMTAKVSYDYAGGNNTINVLVYDANATIDCYQETANASSPSDTEGCYALNYTGSYFAPNQPADNSWHTASKLYDESYDTYTYDWNQADGLDAIFSINYTKPNGVTSAKWRTKVVSTDENLTIPSDCFDYNAGWLFLNITSNGNSNLVKTYCLNDTGYKELSSYSGTNVYEESIIWGDVPGQSDKANGETLNLFVYYSNWNYNLPRYVNYLEFIPSTPTSKNVTPYGQTSNTPILNLTTYNYGGLMNLSIYLNETHSCVNLTYNATGSGIPSVAWPNLLNATWRDISTDLEYMNNTQIWLFANYNCNYTSWRLWYPQISIRGCQINSICSEEAI